MFRTRREKILFIATIVAGIGFFVYTGVIEPMMANFMTTNTEVSVLKTELQELTANLSEIDQIQQEYQDIADYVEDDHPRLNDDLERMVYNICRQAGISNPPMDPVERRAIDDVEGYKKASIRVNFTGDFQNLLRFLEEVKKGAFVVESFNVRVGSDGRMNVTARLMRIVDVQE